MVLIPAHPRAITPIFNPFIMVSSIKLEKAAREKVLDASFCAKDSKLLSSLLLTAFINCYAQKPSDARDTMDQIIKKYDGKQGITTIKVAKGSGLELVKLMFNHEFGKDFMKGVTSITIIDYSSASEDVCIALRKDLDIFVSILEEFDLSDEKDYAGNEYIRCFASTMDSDTISDFVFAMEEGSSKMLMYMAGRIIVE